jgi:hypothetical protein
VNIGGRIYWNTPSFGINQEAYLKLVKIDVDSISQGLVLKAQSSPPAVTPRPTDGQIEVLYNATAGNIRVQTIRPGGAIPTVMYPALAQRMSDGDQLGAQLGSNGVVKIYRNGTLVGSVTLNTADRAYFNPKGGRIGIRFNGTASDAVFDDFGGGNAP